MRTHLEQLVSLRRFGAVFLVLALAVGFGSPVGLAEDDQGEAAEAERLTETLAIPLEDGKISIGRLLDDLIELAASRGLALSDKIKVQMDVTGKVGRLKLDQIERFTAGVVRFEVEHDRLVVKVDRLELRRSGGRMRDQLRTLIELWFPEQAAKATAHFGLRVVAGDDSRVALADTELPDHVVVLVHGMDDLGRMWDTLIPELREAGYCVCEFTYPNDQPIVDSAELLSDEMKQLKKHGVRRA